MSDPKRSISVNGEEIGAFTLNQLYRSLEYGEMKGRVQFWSNFARAWLPVQHIMVDIERENRGDGLTRLDDLRLAGVRYVGVIDPGSKKGVCKTCKGWLKRMIPIEQLDVFPPSTCTCKPWCRCAIVAVEGPDG